MIRLFYDYDCVYDVTIDLNLILESIREQILDLKIALEFCTSLIVLFGVAENSNTDSFFSKQTGIVLYVCSKDLSKLSASFHSPNIEWESPITWRIKLPLTLKDGQCFTATSRCTFVYVNYITIAVYGILYNVLCSIFIENIIKKFEWKFKIQSVK